MRGFFLCFFVFRIEGEYECHAGDREVAEENFEVIEVE